LKYIYIVFLNIQNSHSFQLRDWGLPNAVYDYNCYMLRESHEMGFGLWFSIRIIFSTTNIYIYTCIYIYIIDSCSQVAGFMAIPDKYSRRKSTMSSTSAGRTPLMGVPCAFQNHHLVCKKHVEKWSKRMHWWFWGWPFTELYFCWLYYMKEPWEIS
jgi:hypothetical protein